MTGIIRDYFPLVTGRSVDLIDRLPNGCGGGGDRIIREAPLLLQEEAT